MSQKVHVFNEETGEVSSFQPDGRKPVDLGAREGNLGRARQSEAHTADINVIVRQFRRGVVPAHINQMVGSYAFAPAMDFRSAMEELRKAREVFDALPAKTRDFFAHDPARFVDFAADPKNLEKLVELGLREPEKIVPPALGSAENPIHVASPDGDGGST